MEEHRPEGVFIDSMGTAIADELNSDKIVLDALNFVNRVIRNQFGAFVWFIHHPRKEQIGNKKPKKLDDLYGSRYISALTRSAVLLWPERGNIEVSCLKLTMAEYFKTFDIKRTPGIDFEISGMQDPGNISGPIFGNNTLEDTI
jgi:RecA-family ATPase